MKNQIPLRLVLTMALALVSLGASEPTAVEVLAAENSSD